MTPNPFLATTPAAAVDDAAKMFAPADNTPKTDHHGYELPPETRDYRPSYSRGKYVLPTVDGTPGELQAPRVTSGVKALDDSTGLQKWLVRQTVTGLKSDPYILEDVDLMGEPRDLNRDLDRAADRAQIEAGSKRASELGTAIHAWCEAVERGQITRDDVPSTFKPYTDAYFGTLDAAGVRPVPELVERIVYDDVTGWAGTFDNVYELANGERVIGDKKTSKKTSFRYGLLSFSQQLAVYARATHMLSVDGSGWEPMTAVGDAFAVIAHIPSDHPGTCQLHTIGLEYGRQAVELAEAVRQVRAGASTIAGQWQLPTIVDAIKQSTSPDDLAALWERHRNVWTDELTRIGQAHLDGLK